MLMSVDSLDEVKLYLDAMKELYQSEQGKRKQLQELIAEKENSIKEGLEEKETLGETLVLLQEASAEAREQSVQTMQNLVTRPLQYIFEDNTRFEIDMKTKGENSSAEFSVVTEFDYGTVHADPNGSAGGGKGDITALSLLTTLNCSVGTKITAPLILDEPAKYVSPASKALNVGKFLREISVYFNKQVIHSTHNHDIAGIADRAYEFVLRNGISEVTEVTDSLETV
jgi:DNA repair ATPase RecN